MIEKLKINIYNKTVGYLYQSKTVLSFEYDKDFVNGNIDLSPFMLPKKSGITKFTNRENDCFKGLPHFIADALPDSFGSMITSAAFAKQGRRVDSITILERLSYLGDKALGALEFEPVFAAINNDNQILKLKDLTEAVKKVVYGKLPEVENILISASSSVGGARAKAVIGYNKDKNTIVSGHGKIPDRFEHYLIKFDGVINSDPQGYGNIEYAYYLMALDSGLTMTEAFLLSGAADNHNFVTKRFDRIGNQKIHTQTLCSIIGSDFNKPQTSNYADYFNLANIFVLGYAQKVEMFRRMVFNVMLANRDDHSKNFSFLIDQYGKWWLAPAYDITHAYNNTNPNAWTAQHNLLINGKGTGITKEDLLAEAQTLSLAEKDLQSGINDIQNVANNFVKYADKAGVSEKHKDKIINHLQEVKI